MNPIKLAIIDVGHGTCVLSGQQDQRGAAVRFEDETLEGFLSWDALERLLKAKADSAAKKK